MVQSPQTQSFGLWFGEDFTAARETSRRAKPEPCMQFGETTSEIYLQTWEGPPPPAASREGPQPSKRELA